MTHEKIYHRRIDQAFLGELSPAQAEDLRQHLEGCADCRARYDRAARMERVLSGGTGAIATASPAELDRVGAAVFAALDAERSVGLVERLGAWIRRPGVSLLAAAASAAALVAVLAPGWNRGDFGAGELRARGGPPAVRAATIHAFCLSSEADFALDRARAPACSLSAQLKLSVGNPGDHRFLFLVGVQDDYAPRWYAPRPPETQSTTAPAPQDGEVPFGSATRLAVNHRPGALRIYGLFSDAPLSGAEVSAAIEALSKSDTPLDRADALPLARSDVTQRSVLVEISP